MPDLRQKNRLKILPLNVLLQNLQLLTTPTAELTYSLKKALEDNPLYEIKPPASSSTGEWIEMIASPQSMEEKLLPQIAGCRSTRQLPYGTEKRLIEYLDHRGYLNTEECDIAREMGMDLSTLKTVLEEIRQNIDPPGLFAKDLRQCLMIQLSRKGKKTEDSYMLLHNCSDELGTGDLKKAAQILNWSYERAVKALKALSRLDPSPGNTSISVSMIPEIEFRPGLKPEVRLIHKNLPRITLNHDLMGWNSIEVRRLMKQGYRTTSTLGRRYATKLKIAMEIARLQRDYLLKKSSAPSPLVLSDIALKLGFSASTIQRAITATSCLSPCGPLSLTAFFSRPLRARPEMSVAMLQDHITKARTARKSDAELGRQLNIPARTITWHRRKMGLL